MININEFGVNFKDNRWICLSACAFYLLFWKADFLRIYSIFLAILGCTIMCGFVRDLKQYIVNADKTILVLAILCALGIGPEGFSLPDMLGASPYATLVPFFLYVCAMPALICIFCLIYQYLYENVWKEIRDMVLLQKDFFFLCFCAVVLLAVIVVMFGNTSAYYSMEYDYDIVYTSDTPVFLKEAVWTNLFHAENDWRQPLFALFGAPFLAPLKTICKVFPEYSFFHYVLIAWMNALLTMATGYLLAIRLEKKRGFRFAFLALYLSMYSTLLFSVMMEQYQVAVFWLAVFLFVITGPKSENSCFSWIGATGTLSTSGILLFFTIPPEQYANRTGQNRKEIFHKLVKNGILGILFVVITMKIEIVYSLFLHLVIKSPKAGNCFLQFFDFLPSCFTAPSAKMDLYSHYGWYMDDSARMNYLGLAMLGILLLAVVILAVKGLFHSENGTYNLRFLSLIWFGFGFLLLAIAGYGSDEHSSILYSLYFAWSILVLLYSLVRTLAKNVIPEQVQIVVLFLIALGLFGLNIQSVWNMTQELSRYYPVL